MWPNTRVAEQLEVDYPIIQAPMAGGITTPELVAAVSEAGGLGSVGAGYMSPDDLRRVIQEIRRLTDRPFNVNLFVPSSQAQVDGEMAQTQALLDPYRTALGLPASPSLAWYAPNFEGQMAVVIEERVPVFSFTFGIPDAACLDELKRVGATLIGTATTVREAVELEACGVELIVAQSSEAGGHRGTFSDTAGEALVGAMALIPQVVDRVGVPVVAAGGIMDGRGVAAALALGAMGVQLGTAFVSCSESGANQIYKEALLEADSDQTVITRVFSGKPARGIKNRFITEMAAYEDRLPPYPVQNALTGDIRRAAAQQNRGEFMSLWAGQGLSMSRGTPADQLVSELVKETEAVLQRLASKRM